MFVVSCKVSPSNEVELLLDSDTSVQLETCAAVNRAVNEAMADDEEDFSLTVASAGIGEELKCERQFRKLVGRPVEVLLLNGTKIRALLDAADAGGITLSYEEKQAVEGKKAQAAGEGGQTLRLLRGEIYEGVPGFQVDGSK